MKIQHITIQNFKGFDKKEFSFNPHVTVLIGDNGSGKTTLLEALSFVLGTFFRGVDSVPSRSLRQNEKRRIAVSLDSVEVQLPFFIAVQHTLAGETYHWKRDTNKAKGGSTTYIDAKPLIDKAKELIEGVRSGKEVALPLIAYYGTGRLAGEKYKKQAYTQQGSRLDGYYIALDPSTCKKEFFGWFKSFEDEKLKFNKDARLYYAFTNAIHSMLPGWNKIHFNWAFDDMFGQLENGEWMPFSDLSDGYQNIIRLAADIAYRAIRLNPHLNENAIINTEGVVLIDEIDMHLHPSWQKNIIADLKKTFPNIQFIITTHSPFIVQSLKADEVINLDGAVLSDDPESLTLEDNALFMGVQDPKSTRFIKKVEVAEKYLNLLSQQDILSNSSEKLDTLLAEFSDDPVLIAKLNMQRLKKPAL